MKTLKLLTLLSVIFSTGWRANEAPALVWYSFNEGMAKAKTENKFVLMDVYTDWCGWCKVMDEKTYGDDNVAAYLKEKFVLVRLNPEKDGTVSYKGRLIEAAALAQGMGIDGYPATVFFEPTGDAVTMVSGYIQAGEFLKMIKFIGGRHYLTTNYSDFVKNQ